MEESLFSIILSFGYQRRSLILQYFTLDLEVWESSFLTLGKKSTHRNPNGVKQKRTFLCNLPVSKCTGISSKITL